jgi:hypothetical protein
MPEVKREWQNAHGRKCLLHRHFGRG